MRPTCQTGLLARLAKTASPENRGDPMLRHFPQAVLEISVSNVEKATEYYVRVLGFRFDWGNG